MKNDTLSFFDLRMETAARVGLRSSAKPCMELSESAAADGEARIAGSGFGGMLRYYYREAA